MTAHNILFTFPKFEDRKHSYYTWRDEMYSEFMISLMSKLKPRFYKVGKVFINELDTIVELNFLIQGSYAVGFEVNKTKQFVRFFGKRSTFGCYNCIFNKKSYFVWQCVERIEAFAITKREWLEIEEEHEELCKIFKKKIA
jgi:hypothetical protein